MDITLIIVAANTILNGLVIGLLKPWLGAYGGEKGKNFARKEDLDAILAEVRAVTITQKEIEAQLSGDLWNQQTRRGEKKTVYGDILSALHDVIASSNDMHAVATMLNGELDDEIAAKLEGKLQAALVEFINAEKLLIKLQGQAAIFTTPYCSVRLAQFLNIRRDTNYQEPAELRAYVNRALKLQSDIIALAKTDLGISGE